MKLIKLNDTYFNDKFFIEAVDPDDASFCITTIAGQQFAYFDNPNQAEAERQRIIKEINEGSPC